MDDIIEQIKRQVNIVDIARRAGYEPNRSDFITSIYHDEKTPSLKLYPESNSFCDFSASLRGGSIIDFYMDLHGVDLKTAIDELAEIAGISREKNANRGERVRQYPKVKFIDAFDRTVISAMNEDELEMFWTKIGLQTSIPNDYEFELTDKRRAKIKRLQNQALKSVQKMRMRNNASIFSELYSYCKKDGMSERAYNYLVFERRLSEELLNKFKIFEIKNYHKVNQHMKKQFNLDDLKRSGLFNEKGNLIFAFHRIIIPYLFKGMPVYLRGRYFDNDGKTEAEGYSKYIGIGNDAVDVNSAKRFYNVDVITEALQAETIYITEGEFDAIAIEQLRFNAIAIPGAGNIPPENWLRALQPFNIVVCVDNDRAGSELQVKLEKEFERLEINYAIKELPNKDVNEFLKTVSN